MTVTSKGQEEGAHTHNSRLGWVSVVKCLPRMCEALGSISTTTKQTNLTFLAVHSTQGDLTCTRKLQAPRESLLCLSTCCCFTVLNKPTPCHHPSWEWPIWSWEGSQSDREGCYWVRLQ